MTMFSPGNAKLERERKRALVKGDAAASAAEKNTADNRQNAAADRSLFLEGSHTGETRETVSPEAQAKARRVAACFELVARGRVEALGDLYDAVATDLFGYIRSIVGSAADAEDVFQEVFARIAARGAKLVTVEKPLAYVFTIARNEAFAHLARRAGARRAVDEAPLFGEVAAPAGEEPALTPEEASSALAQLPIDQREAVVLKIYQGFTFAQIADVTEVSLNTAASRYRYGINKLARLLGRVVGEDRAAPGDRAATGDD